MMITISATSPAGRETERKKRNYTQLTSEAAQEFSRLYQLHYIQHGTIWSFSDFELVWDTAEYGTMEANRWKTRNQTEKRARDKNQIALTGKKRRTNILEEVETS